MTSVFVGLVSHKDSPRQESQGPYGLAQMLSDELSDLGFDTTSRVNTENAFTASGDSLTAEVLATSPAEELRIEKRWAGYLGIDTTVSGRFTRTLRWLKYFVSRTTHPNVAAIVRLANIELSHRNLLSQALDMQFDWVVILEDDALCLDPQDLALGLAGIINSSSPPSLVSLSLSFTPEQLRVDHLLHPLPTETWRGTMRRTILTADRPVTNTVCANMYSGQFARVLHDELAHLPFTPIAPIDWKVNQALMNLYGRRDIGSGDCWWLSPAPIIQGSMHP